MAAEDVDGETDGGPSIVGRDMSFDDGVSVMIGRCVGGGGTDGTDVGGGGERERDRSESAGDGERLLQLRSHKSGVMRGPVENKFEYNLQLTND